jgi:hypothetical protein
MMLPSLSLLIINRPSSEWILDTANGTTRWKTVGLERPERRLLAGKEHHPSFKVANNEMERCARNVLHKKCQPLGVVVCRHRLLVPPFPVETHRAQLPMRFLISEPRVAAS